MVGLLCRGGQEVTRHGGQGGVCAVLQLQPRGGVVSGERVEGGCHGKGAPAARVHGSCLGVYRYTGVTNWANNLIIHGMRENSSNVG